MPTEFIPRASSLGYYMSCEYRALLDSLVHAGELPAPDEPDDTKYADLGTCIHWEWQRALGATLPDNMGPPTQDEFEAIEAQFESAATLFDSFEECSAAITNAATHAAEIVQSRYPGATWLAESAHELDKHLTGHIDLISPDYKTIIDLKTVSRKPDYGRPKVPHIYQLVAYYLLTGQVAERGVLLYVDAMKANWTLWCEVDFTTSEFKRMADRALDQLGRITTPDALASAIPRFGTHCQSDFCKHRHRCRDRYIPGPGVLVERTPSRRRATDAVPSVTIGAF